jgi:hypothetical protein
MTIQQYETALQKTTRELSETREQILRMEVAWNLTLNHAIHTFATFITPNDCEHTFGVGIAVKASRSGADEVVILWQSNWKKLGARNINVFSPETFRETTNGLREVFANPKAPQPYTIGRAELEIMEQVCVLLDHAEIHYRSTRLHQAVEKPSGNSGLLM